jgi:hypothetical protein
MRVSPLCPQTEKDTLHLPADLEAMVAEDANDKEPRYDHKNSFSGSADPHGVACRVIPVHTFKIWLPATRKVFGDVMQHWNVEYKKAAQIFGPGNELVATLVATGHDVLFRTSAQPTVLKSGADLREMLSSWKMTFALTDKYLYLGETGIGPKDWLSKHALHSRAAEEVRCAGSFWFEETKLVICNDSGTYTPTKESLELFRKLLLFHFPDLDVEYRVHVAEE